MRPIDADALYRSFEEVYREPDYSLKDAAWWFFGKLGDAQTIASREEADMDCKELIDALRTSAKCGDFSFACENYINAADAIEMLLLERDAAVETLRYMGCDVCKHKKVDWAEEPCYSCHRVGGGKDGWQWRGPQKEGSSDGQA